MKNIRRRLSEAIAKRTVTFYALGTILMIITYSIAMKRVDGMTILLASVEGFWIYCLWALNQDDDDNEE